MDDFISREAALSAQNKSMNLNEMRERLKRIPAADVRPVVLCRDCAHYLAHSGGSGYCGFLDIGTSQEAFCSHGEKGES